MKHRLLSIFWAIVLAFGFPVSVLGDVSIDTQTNTVRSHSGLAPLISNDALASLALIRAQQVVDVWAHPTDWQWMFDYVPGCEEVLGENIANIPVLNPGADWPVQAWVGSPSHYANMLGDWTHQGSARYTTGGTTYAVQLFSRACDSPAPPVPQPAPGAPPFIEPPDTHM